MSTRPFAYLLGALLACANAPGGLLRAQVPDSAIANPLAAIYPVDAPRLTTLWQRAADVSARLRSVEACEFSPDGRLAVAGGKFGYRVQVWRVADGTLAWERAHDSEIECVTFSPDGTQVASAGEDYMVRVWDAASGDSVRRWELGASIDGIAWGPDGRWLVAGTEAGEAVFFDARAGERVGAVDCGSTINSLDFSRDGRRLLVGGNIQTPADGPGGTVYTGFAKVIDVDSRTVVRELGEVPGSVKSVRYSPDERYFATAGFDRAARLYETESGELVHTFTDSLKLEAVAFTPDGQYLVAGGHGRYLLWYRLRDRTLVLRQPTPRVEYVDFSRDGRLMLTGHEDSGVLGCYLLESDVQARGTYQQVADEQLSNRDLRGE